MVGELSAPERSGKLTRTDWDANPGLSKDLNEQRDGGVGGMSFRWSKCP